MFCTTECWDCEYKTCKHYISKSQLYFENQQLKSVLDEIRVEMDNNLSYDENIDDCWTTTNELYKILDKVNE